MEPEVFQLADHPRLGVQILFRLAPRVATGILPMYY
jgi:hypothetical protein